MALLLDIAKLLRWQDIVDVAILTLLLFRAYLWLRGTVALQVLIGMLILVGSGFVAAELGLILTAYVLQALGAVVTLTAVVLFRDEIRQGLRQANPLRWWRSRKSSGEQRDQYVELAESVFALAQKRIGALVVLPGIDQVDEHVTGGTELDARLSPLLFEAIFHTGSPIHDGAAVVDGACVRRAGAFLPLSTSAQLPKRYGTRHRAAAGLTEQCDAVVLIASEESGNVSLAAAGRIAVAPTPEVLAERIARTVGRGSSPAPRRATMMIAATATPSRRRLIDTAWFSGILVFVLTAWYSVAGDRNTIITPTVPLELRNLPAGLDVDPPQPAQVTLHLRGPRKLLLESDRDELETWVNLDKLEPGVRRMNVSAAAPAGVVVEKVQPDTVVLRARKAPPTPKLKR